MPTISEKAQGYIPKQIETVADLDVCFTAWEVLEKTEAEFPYYYVLVNNKQYKVPNSVLSDLKEIIKIKPTLKTFKVTKSGSGLKTNYTVIPLE